ncbi:MAG: glycosyl hydrolase family 17 [Candidatus Marinimicrobia bacterium]|nr:glycosyl hydrolase family 17 [Candidatus Neomarinimicrobiota bacterium]
MNSLNKIFIFTFILSISFASDLSSKNRKLVLSYNDEWIGMGAAYGPFRDGQAPWDGAPSIEELREDLHIISKSWKWIRLYGSRGISSDILNIIRNDSLGIKVMLGAWIAKEDGTIEASNDNKDEISNTIKLANEYPDVVNSINIGNETMVYWSDHKVDLDIMANYLNYTRKRVRVPVTTADDLGFWNKEESKKIAEQCDFIVVHIHPLWGGQSIEKSLDWVKEIYAQIKLMHPSKEIVIGETGWATMKHNEGLQHELIKGNPSEKNQKLYYDNFRKWAAENQIPHHFFEIFDEKWKGGDHPNEVEKHWGVYYSNRKPKQAMK